MGRIYYRGANGVFLVYDITNRDSFTAITRWFAEFSETSEDFVGCILGNKTDLAKKSRAVSTAEGEELASNLGCIFGVSSEHLQKPQIIVERKFLVNSISMRLVKS